MCAPPILSLRFSNSATGTSCVVTDQRPIQWASPSTLSQTQSSVQPNHDGTGANNLVKHGRGATVVVSCVDNKITTTASARWYTTALSVGFNTAFAVGDVVRVSGGTGVTGGLGVANNIDCLLTAVTTTRLTCADPNTPAANTECITGDVVVFTRPEATLVDAKTVAKGDRVRLKRGTGDYERRTVDTVWGAGLEMTMFSVADPFTATPTSLVNVPVDAWVDESGSTEAMECGRRGLCDRESGTCHCFPGFWLPDCSGITATFFDPTA